MAYKNYFKPSYMRGNKYNAQKHEVDGIKFDSLKEAERYCELSILQKAGEISDLQTQVKYILIPAQREEGWIGSHGAEHKGKLIEREVAYYADFVYKDKDGNTVVEDVKGYKDGGAYSLFAIKRKLMLYIHNIRIKEI